MEKELFDALNNNYDDNKQPEWTGTSVKQVRLISSKDLTRLQSDMNKELLTLTLANNQIENIRTYQFVESNTVRYIGEITYITFTIYESSKRRYIRNTSEKNNK